ncbi:MAG: OmpA family protein [Treponema sp.]|nr:OmpA family protein [Treponema sp.]
MLVFFAYPLLFLPAQTAGEIDVILETPRVTFTQASRFTLVAADVVDEHTEAAAALEYALAQGWLPKKAGADNPIRLGELCALIMKAFDIKGSFLYSWFPGPRYAFRELDYLRLIPGQRDPAQTVSGERLLQILGMAAVYAGIEDRDAGEAPAVQTAGEAAFGVLHIIFAADSTELRAEEQEKIREIIPLLERYPDRKILVAGYTALAGSAEGRMRIAEGRAWTVAGYLLSLGILRSAETVVLGCGAENPAGDNATAEGRALNRRVEISFLD